MDAVIDILQHLALMLLSGIAGAALAVAWIGGGAIGLGLVVVAVVERLNR